jgi:5-methylcytosine-specific restriction endonuclease McrA
MAYVYPFMHSDEKNKRDVWVKGKRIDRDAKGKSFDPNVWRWDKCGAVMHYSEHGNRNSEHGWEIDHIIPTSKGGRDVLTNLQPLNWKNNAKKGDTHPWRCS